MSSGGNFALRVADSSCLPPSPSSTAALALEFSTAMMRKSKTNGNFIFNRRNTVQQHNTPIPMQQCNRNRQIMRCHAWPCFLAFLLCPLFACQVRLIRFKLRRGLPDRRTRSESALAGQNNKEHRPRDSLELIGTFSSQW